MKNKQLTFRELKAARAAGGVAGDWLDELGKTDLATLSADEWDEFLGLIILGYGVELNRLIESGEAPF